MDASELGKKAEEIAIEYLESHEYDILEKNWTYRQKEIDIIAMKDNFIVFVEVKGRGGKLVREPEESVDRQKQKFLIEAANAYIQKNDIDMEARFDIISVIFQGEKHKLHHIDDAFYPIFR